MLRPVQTENTTQSVSAMNSVVMEKEGSHFAPCVVRKELTHNG